MREILFRGKNRNNEWIQGNLLCYPDVNRAFIHVGDYFKGGACEVIKSTVGQFTGVLDENGRKIFEGDLIQIRFEGDAEPPSTPPVWYETGKVVWHGQLHGWYVIFDSPDGIPIQEYDDCDGVFVIGNIHDNPELLEGA